jgi:nucleoside diphosphate kinase
MVLMNKEIGREFNIEKDISMVTIKPEPLSDGRAEKIIEFLSSYCNNNGLTIIRDTNITIKKEHILEHYGGPNKLVEVGKKVLASIRMQNPETKAKLEGMGFTSKSEEELGMMIRDKELRDYPGKEFRVLIIVGRDALSKLRSLRGASDPSISGRGTLRHEFSTGMTVADILLYNKPLDNVVHTPLSTEELCTELYSIFNMSPKEMLDSTDYVKSLIR